MAQVARHCGSLKAMPVLDNTRSRVTSAMRNRLVWALLLASMISDINNFSKEGSDMGLNLTIYCDFIKPVIYCTPLWKSSKKHFCETGHGNWHEIFKLYCATGSKDAILDTFVVSSAVWYTTVAARRQWRECLVPGPFNALIHSVWSPSFVVCGVLLNVCFFVHKLPLRRSRRFPKTVLRSVLEFDQLVIVLYVATSVSTFLRSLCSLKAPSHFRKLRKAFSKTFLKVVRTVCLYICTSQLI